MVLQSEVLNGKSSDKKLIYSWRDLNVFSASSEKRSAVKNNVVTETTSLLESEGKNTKHLLRSISGYAESGQLLAIMGSSGAGKTTLLNVLSQQLDRTINVSENTHLQLNSMEITRRNSNSFRKFTAFIQQTDLFIGALTCKEHLHFQAMLRLPSTFSSFERALHVKRVIRDLCLQKCENTPIGTIGRSKGLSGGERKRLSFATEILTDPLILFCDEPTSGLDAFMALNIIKILKRLTTDSSKMIILTIHQPSSEIYELFDSILLLSNGRTLYQGPRDTVMSYFGFEVETNSNPADLLIERAEAFTNNDRMWTQFTRSNLYTKITMKYEESKQLPSLEFDVQKNKPSRWQQFVPLIWRSWLTTIKEPMLLKVRLTQTIMVATVIGIIFFNQSLSSVGVINMNGAIFLFLTNMTFQNVFAVINVFSTEIHIFMRERKSNLYTTFVYFMAKTLAELPLFLLIPVIFTSIAYPLIGLQMGIKHFAIAIFIVVLVANVATSFGYMISCVSRNVNMALSIGPPIIIPFLLFGGYFLNQRSITPWLRWLPYLSWFHYGNEALLVNQWGDIEEGVINCTGGKNSTCPSSGEIILQTFNFSQNNLLLDVICLFALIFVFRTIAYASLHLKTVRN